MSYLLFEGLPGPLAEVPNYQTNFNKGRRDKMASVKEFFQHTQDQAGQLWQQLKNTAIEPAAGPSDDFQEPLVNGKDSNMLKMGNREENNTPFSAGYEGGATRTGISKETLIGENITIEGTVHAKEDIVVEGRIKGTVEAKSHRITIGPKGHIEADVDAEDAVISGKMIGKIVAHNKVQITKDADFTGSIIAKRIAIEDGAYIKATIELEKQERQKEKANDAIVFESSDPAAQKPVKGDSQSAKSA
jgi:cytoskeletal protein CcmA (bactofilin family)